jgi:hypothetical protein
MSKAVNVPSTTLHRMMHNEGLFHRHTSALQPHLTDEHNMARFMYALEEVYHNPRVHLTLTSMIWVFFCSSTGQLQWGDTHKMMRLGSYSMSHWHTNSMIQPRSIGSG